MKGHFLIVSVDCLTFDQKKVTLHVNTYTNLFGIDGKRALALAVRTVTDFHLLRRILVEWAQNRSAFPTVEFNVLQLWKYASASRHDAGHANKIIEVGSAKIT